VGTIAFLIGFFFLKEHREEAPGRFDVPGFVLAGAGFALAMFALSDGATRGWGSPVILTTGLVGVAILAVFVVVELRTAAPMVQLRLLGNRLFRACLVTSMSASAGFVGVLFVVPLFLQEARGASPLESGLSTFPEAIGVVASTQLVARLYPRFGPRRLMAGGLVLVAASIAGLCLIDLESSDWLVRGLMFMIGVGMAYIFLPNQAAGLATISREQTGRASTMFSVQRQLGAAIGVATLGSVLAAVGAEKVGVSGEMVPNIDAYRVAFLAAAGFALLGAFLAFMVPYEDAAETIRRGGQS
jgi:predicted MFS family arabinose efflux permease